MVAIPPFFVELAVVVALAIVPMTLLWDLHPIFVVLLVVPAIGTLAFAMGREQWSPPAPLILMTLVALVILVVDQVFGWANLARPVTNAGERLGKELVVLLGCVAALLAGWHVGQRTVLVSLMASLALLALGSVALVVLETDSHMVGLSPTGVFGHAEFGLLIAMLVLMILARMRPLQIAIAVSAVAIVWIYLTGTAPMALACALILIMALLSRMPWRVRRVGWALTLGLLVGFVVRLVVVDVRTNEGLENVPKAAAQDLLLSQASPLEREYRRSVQTALWAIRMDTLSGRFAYPVLPPDAPRAKLPVRPVPNILDLWARAGLIIFLLLIPMGVYVLRQAWLLERINPKSSSDTWPLLLVAIIGFGFLHGPTFAGGFACLGFLAARLAHSHESFD